MTTTDDSTDLALAPLRQELVRAARADAEAELAAAHRTAETQVAAAHAEAARLVEAARAEGDRVGEMAAAATLAQARSTARARELAARRELFDALLEQVTGRLSALRTASAYDDLRTALTTRARHLLGPGAVLTEPPGGGVVATAPGRRVDLSLTSLARLAVELAADAAEGLWTS